MKYIEGMDYWVRYVQFPNMASESVAASHGDGTFTIFINTLFPEAKQQARLRHELRHFCQEHFYRDDLTITQIERAADEQNPGGESRVLPGPAPAFVALRDAEMPEDVSFGFRLPDDSLYPHFARGQLLYCDDRPLTPGDVGLFQYRGVTMCRRYHRDVFGITYLFALNRRQAREDIAVPACEEQELLYLGRVRTENTTSSPTGTAKNPI